MVSQRKLIMGLLDQGVHKRDVARLAGASIKTVSEHDWVRRNYDRYLERQRVRDEHARRSKGIQPRQPYPAERDAVIRRDYGNRSASEIAADLGVTKNAVIGRAHRLGLSAD